MCHLSRLALPIYLKLVKTQIKVFSISYHCATPLADGKLLCKSGPFHITQATIIGYSKLLASVKN